MPHISFGVDEVGRALLAAGRGGVIYSQELLTEIYIS